MTGNRAASGGGASGVLVCNLGCGIEPSTLYNCIVLYNTASKDPNYEPGTLLNYSCAAPLPETGVGNIDLDPELASASHLSAHSPCIGRGNYASVDGIDIDGTPWRNPPSIGCDEFDLTATGPLTLSATASYTTVLTGFTTDFFADINGNVSASRWEFNDGTIISNRPYASHAWNAIGDYPVILRAYNQTYAGGLTATVTVHVVTQPVHYVTLNNASSAAPYTSWATAATNIQDAVDAATVPGALVLVTNGVYKTGSRVVEGTTANRIAVQKVLEVRSVNGPLMTIVEGSSSPPTRCAYLTNGASLSGFTLTNGWVQHSISDYSGGGAYGGTLTNCMLVGNSAQNGAGAALCTLNNCTLAGNYADNYGGGAHGSILESCTLTNNHALFGGGAYQCTLNNCAVRDNTAIYGGGGVSDSVANNSRLSGNLAQDGGGAFQSKMNNCSLSRNTAQTQGGGANTCALNNCIITGNSAVYGGGVNEGAMTNCIAYYNTASAGAPNYYQTFEIYYSCTSPLPDGGAGNLDAEPQLASASHLSASSPCVRRGTYASVTGRDIDGQPWANPPSIGCDEVYVGFATGAVTVATLASYSTAGMGFAIDFQALIEGNASASRWEFGDGTILSNRPYASHAWSAVGDYPVVLRVYNDSFPGGVTATTIVHIIKGEYYVNLNNPTPAAPYTSWETAATNIQDAVDAASIVGAIVVVTNGVYQTGGRLGFGSETTNRVVIDKPITVRSVNGPEFTAIRGHHHEGTTTGNSAIRCVYLANNARLVGFTLTNGAAGAPGGGGVFCWSTTAAVSNCVIGGNVVASVGGGVYSGTLYNCTLVDNHADNGGGGAGDGVLNECTLIANSSSYGGGAGGATLNNCTLADNIANGGGGGVISSTLNNCNLIRNKASQGGGAFDSTLDHCTLRENNAYEGGGVYGGALKNCTLTRNFADYGGGANGSGFGPCILKNCALTENSASEGGGAATAELINCTLTGNSGFSRGGGLASCYATNCIVYHNTAPIDPNYFFGGFDHSCTTPLPPGVRNLDSDPALASAIYLTVGSPCIASGSSAVISGTDIEGEAWRNPPSIGCDEFYAGSAAGALTAAVSTAYTNVAVGFPLDMHASITGHPSILRWDFGDGSVVTNRPHVSHAWEAAGDYIVVLRVYNATYPGGISATAIVHVATAVHYVALDSASPAAPYTSWTTAATNIQDAIDATSALGALVLVTNGVYQTGGRRVYDITNRVSVDKVIRIQSVNGPAVTVIKGYQVPAEGGGPTGEAAIRCVYLTNRASLTGFTITNGATATYTFSQGSTDGGGLWCESTGSTISNCVISGNLAQAGGGGAYQGTFHNCVLARNRSGSGGAAYLSTLNNCTISNNVAEIGGGTYYSTLNACTLTGNSAKTSGGGSYDGTLDHCVLTGNTATNMGGGASGGTLNDCMLTGNEAESGGGAAGAGLINCTLVGNRAFQNGGGCAGGTVIDCTVSGNSARNSGGGASGGELYNSRLIGNSAEFGGGAFLSSTGFTVINCTVSGNTAYWAGGVYGGTLKNSVLTDNSAFWAGGTYLSELANCTVVNNGADFSGGTYYGTLYNCIVISNSAAVGENYLYSTLNYSCTTPLPTNGVGNIQSDPLFADYGGANLRLQPGSPCINSGLNAYVVPEPDPDGNRRIVGGTVDMGAYEFQSPVSSISYGWLRQYGFAPDTGIDATDSDGDGANNLQEWIAGTVPTNALSALRLLSPVGNTWPRVLTWQSVNNRMYTLERATNLGDLQPFSVVTINIVGQAGTTTYADTNAVGPGPFFYRVGTER
ncbi:MAG TPA: PKD domain-containing protein [Verrucomicrobiae bacterium]|nr:PKD domain-containing protein [Verrucomicrobiae bacterium]